MRGTVPSSAIPPDPAVIGTGGKVLIWFLAILIYGGGLSGWFLGIGAVEKKFAHLVPQRQEYHPDYGDPAEKVKLSDFEYVKKEEEVPAPVTKSESHSFFGGTHWPSIKIDGTMAAKEGKGAAILDGTIVPVGLSHKNVTVVSVDKKTVTLRFGDDVQVFATGSSTE